MIVLVLYKLGVFVKYIVSSWGLFGIILVKKYGIVNFIINYKDILQDEEVDVVFIIICYDVYVGQVVEVLQAGKYVFVEKLLVLSYE